MKRTSLLLLLAAARCGGASGNSNNAGAGSGFAVIATDAMYSSTMLTLVDPDGTKLVHDDCLDSGVKPASLSLALSGDVVLAGGTQANGDILLIDRQNSALDWVKPGACTVDAQLSVGTGFYSNPQAVVVVAASKAYVTRNEPNKTGGSAAGNDLGDDILIIDPTAQAVTGHIDLSAYAGTSPSATILPRPGAAIAGNGKVWVALGNDSEDFKTTVDGAILGVDPASDTIAATLTLTGYKSCGGLDYQDATKTLLVSCAGDFYADTFADKLGQSAILLVDVSGATPAIKQTIPAATLGGRPVGGAVFAGDNLIVATTMGDFSGATAAVDSLWAVAADSGSASKIVDSGSAGDFGNAVAQTDLHAVLLTDAAATAPAIRVFDVGTPSAITQKTSFAPDPKKGLLPRQIGAYQP